MSNIIEKREKVITKSTTRINKNRSLHNIYQTEDATFLEVSLPGYSKEEVELKVIKDTLRINSLPVKESKETFTGNYVSKGFEKIAFEDNFIIPEDVEKEMINAELKEGVLYVTFPIKAEVNINKIIKIK